MNKIVIFVIVFLIGYDFAQAQGNGQVPRVQANNILLTPMVDTMAQLQTLVPIHYDKVQVARFYTLSIGGGGEFYWDDTAVSTAIPGMIIQVTGISTGRWKRKLDNTSQIPFSNFGGKEDSSEEGALVTTAATFCASQGKALYMDIPNGKIWTSTYFNFQNINHLYLRAVQGTKWYGDNVASTGIMYFGGMTTTQGVVATTVSSATNIHQGDTIINVVSTSGMYQNQYIAIRSSGQIYDPMRPVYQSEMTQIKNVISSTAIQLVTGIDTGYNTSAYTVYVDTFQVATDIRLDEIHLFGKGHQYGQYGLKFNNAANVVVTNSSCDSSGIMGLMLNDVWKATVENWTTKTTYFPGYGYGVELSSVNDGYFHNIRAYRNRHGIDIGGTYVGLHNIWDGIFADDCTSAGVSTHSASKDLIITNCHVTNCGGGVVIRSPYTLVSHVWVNGFLQGPEAYGGGLFTDDGPGHLQVGGRGQMTNVHIDDFHVDMKNQGNTNVDGIRSYGAWVNCSLTNSSFVGFLGQGFNQFGNGSKNVLYENLTFDCHGQVGVYGSSSLHGYYGQGYGIVDSSDHNAAPWMPDTNVVWKNVSFFSPITSSIRILGFQDSTRPSQNLVFDGVYTDSAYQGILLYSGYYGSVIAHNNVINRNGSSSYIQTFGTMTDPHISGNWHNKQGQTGLTYDGPNEAFTATQMTNLVDVQPSALWFNILTNRWNYKVSSTTLEILDSASIPFYTKFGTNQVYIKTGDSLSINAGTPVDMFDVGGSVGFGGFIGGTNIVSIAGSNLIQNRNDASTTFTVSNGSFYRGTHTSTINVGSTTSGTLNPWWFESQDASNYNGQTNNFGAMTFVRRQLGTHSTTSWVDINFGNTLQNVGDSTNIIERNLNFAFSNPVTWSAGVQSINFTGGSLGKMAFVTPITIGDMNALYKSWATDYQFVDSLNKWNIHEVALSSKRTAPNYMSAIYINDSAYRFYDANLGLSVQGMTILKDSLKLGVVPSGAAGTDVLLVYHVSDSTLRQIPANSYLSYSSAFTLAQTLAAGNTATSGQAILATKVQGGADTLVYQTPSNNHIRVGLLDLDSVGTARILDTLGVGTALVLNNNQPIISRTTTGANQNLLSLSASSVLTFFPAFTFNNGGTFNSTTTFGGVPSLNNNIALSAKTFGGGTNSMLKMSTTNFVTLSNGTAVALTADSASNVVIPAGTLTVKNIATGAATTDSLLTELNGVIRKIYGPTGYIQNLFATSKATLQTANISINGALDLGNGSTIGFRNIQDNGFQILAAFTTSNLIQLGGGGLYLDSAYDIDFGLNSKVYFQALRLGHDTTITASSYSATTNDYYIRVDATSGSVTISLPSAGLMHIANAGGFPDYRQYSSEIHIKRIDSSGNTVTVQAQSGQTIDGSNTVTLSAKQNNIYKAGTTTSWDID